MAFGADRTSKLAAAETRTSAPVQMATRSARCRAERPPRSHKASARRLRTIATLLWLLLALVARGEDVPGVTRGQPFKKDTSPAAYCLENPDFNNGFGGQCTAFCWGRALEKLGIRLPSWGNAQDWYGRANRDKTGPWQTSSEPKANSIVVWSYTVPGHLKSGHVAFIEEVHGDRVVLSEANYVTYQPKNPDWDPKWGGGYDGVLKTMKVAELAERKFIKGVRGELLGYIWLSAATLGEASRPGFNDSGIIALVCTIRTAETSYKENHGVYARSFAQLTDTNQPNFLMGEWRPGCSKAGYTFTLADKSGKGACYELTACPVTPGKTGTRFFYCDCSGVIRANVGSVADSTSTPIEKENKDLSTVPSNRAPSRDTNNSRRPPAPPPVPAYPPARRTQSKSREAKGLGSLPKYDWNTSGIVHKRNRDETVRLWWWLDNRLNDDPKRKRSLEALAEAIQAQTGGFGIFIYEYFQIGENLWVSGEYAEGLGFICHSGDNGISWERQWCSSHDKIFLKRPVTNEMGYLIFPLYGIYFSNQNEGWAFSLFGILHTNDGGSSWKVILDDEDGHLDNLFILDENKLFATSGEYYYVSEDNGLNWKKVVVNEKNKQELSDLKESCGGKSVHYGGIYAQTNSGAPADSTSAPIGEDPKKLEVGSQEEQNIINAVNSQKKVTDRGGHIKQVSLGEKETDGVIPFEAEVINERGMPIGKVTGRRIEGFGTAELHYQWDGEPPEPDPKPEPPKTKPQPAKETPTKPGTATQQGSKPGPATKPGSPFGTNGPGKTGISAGQGLPTTLGSWVLLVQSKVERFWQTPTGLRLNAAENEALVSFWVDRNGNLIGEPQVIKRASALELGESGVRAIRLAVPLPPLPDDFRAMEQEVVLRFTLAE